MAKPNRPDYFDQDDPDDQHQTIADAADNEEAGDTPVLVSKSALAGRDCKVGDTITLRVQAIHDDEYELVPQGGGESEDEEEAESDAETEGAEVAVPAGEGASLPNFD